MRDIRQELIIEQDAVDMKTQRLESTLMEYNKGNNKFNLDEKDIKLMADQLSYMELYSQTLQQRIDKLN